MTSCGDRQDPSSEKPESTSDSSSEDIGADGWNPQNILSRPTEKDDIRIGTYVSFADTATGLLLCGA